MKSKLLKISDVAFILNVSEERAYSLAREGLIPTVRLGRQVRVDEQALISWIQYGGQALSGGWRKEENL
jgi:excisionase family DNA binding protein